MKALGPAGKTIESDKGFATENYNLCIVSMPDLLTAVSIMIPEVPHGTAYMQWSFYTSGHQGDALKSRNNGLHYTDVCGGLRPWSRVLICNTL